MLVYQRVPCLGCTQDTFCSPSFSPTGVTRLSLLGDDHLHRQPGAPCLFLRCFEVFQEVWKRISLLGRSIWQYEICIRREQINLSGTAPIQELEKNHFVSFMCHKIYTRNFGNTNTTVHHQIQNPGKLSSMAFVLRWQCIDGQSLSPTQEWRVTKYTWAGA